MFHTHKHSSNSLILRDYAEQSQEIAYQYRKVYSILLFLDF